LIYLIYISTLITAVYFCSYFFVLIGFAKNKKKSEEKPNNFPVNKISIIIPVRNEENNIVNCLDSLLKQNYNQADFEVIIINDHSTDNTANVINDYVKESELDIKFYHLTTTYQKKEALKYGIEKSKYEVIASTDADCILPINWLNNISLQINNNTDMLLGPVIFKEQPGLLSGFQTLDMLAIQGLEFGMSYFNKPIINNAANLSYLKKDYYNVNGFDEFNTPSGDDIFLLEKFKSNNNKVIGLAREDFVVLTTAENSFIGFLNQRLRWSSKTTYYSDKWLIYFSGIVLIQNISLIFIYLGLLLVEKYLIILVILLFCKWLIDFILLFLTASFFKRRKALYYFIPVQVIYPFYILFVWISSMLVTFEWKGRKFNGNK
jgi:cellulose synthase/poly-beta-1,6-N-acetylglucosamine synthase-like glycosyltransferase